MQATRAQVKGLRTLTTRGDFLKIQNNGQKWVSQGLILQVAPNQTGSIRVGFTVSKKVHKSAVKRNRIKRRLRAVAADVLSRSGCLGVDYVLVGRSASTDKPYDVLVRDMIWCMKKTQTFGVFNACDAP